MIMHTSGRRRAGRKRGGFTLPEVVIAAAIMASGLAIFMSAFTFAAKCVYDARNQMMAMNFAREQVENRRRFPFRDANLNTGTYNYTSALYRATVVISTLRPEEKSVAVTVLWTNYALRAACTARYESIICNAVH
jgi:prepilin-type N-terminal cleavage/methylation domain-containing protein